MRFHIDGSNERGRRKRSRLQGKQESRIEEERLVGRGDQRLKGGVDL